MRRRSLCRVALLRLGLCKPTSSFSLPAVALARTPRYGAAQIMAAAAGYPAAAEKLLLSEPISADEAQAMRLITRVIDDEHLDQVVAAKTARLAVLPPGAVAGTKALLAAARRKALADLTDYEEKPLCPSGSLSRSRRSTESFSRRQETHLQNRR